MGTERIRRKLDDEPSAAPVGVRPLPERLRAGVESLSGFELGEVRVHYGSSEPSRVGALAYAQGHHIHLAPGQEEHLPHEAWHVVQQAQGRVAPTTRIHRGIALNENSALEREAERMGAQANRIQPRAVASPARTAVPGPNVRQLMRDGSKATLATLAALNVRLKQLNKSAISPADFEMKLDPIPTGGELDAAVAASNLEITNKTPPNSITSDLVTHLELARAGGSKKSQEAEKTKKSPREVAAWDCPKVKGSKGHYYGGGADDLHVHDVSNDAFLKGPDGRKPIIKGGVVDVNGLAAARSSLVGHGKEKLLNSAIDRALLENKKSLD